MPQEIELKYRLPGLDGRTALQRLRRHPLLRRRTMQRMQLLNRYYDTPDGWLRQQRCALRLRATVDCDAEGQPLPGAARWEQTLKTAGSGNGALSVRNEWTTPLTRPRLQLDALQATPLGALERAAEHLAQLTLQAQTRSLRTTWVLHLRGGAVVEVALDDGELRAGRQRAALLELELELLRGEPAALLGVADALAEILPLLPARPSKAEQAQRLAAGTLLEPVRATIPAMPTGTTALEVARAALADALGQLCDNLALAMASDNPELIHQARVGWRRWRSVMRLVQPWLPSPPPDLTPLRPLLGTLGVLRDWDVARTDTLPAWGRAFVEDPAVQPARAQALRAALRRLDRAAQAARAQLRQHLRDPAVVGVLHALAAWLVALPTATTPEPPPDWAFARLRRWHARLKRQLAASDHASPEAMESLHEARLLAKRLRYAAEALGAALSQREAERAQRWQRRARGWQERLGRWRDTARAAELLQQVQADAALIGFLRGVAAATHPLRAAD
ncbi:Inorganic triphosphatase [Tepidimonas alkaliphilus]|uniref:Inorganic triphosphatase n=1 Tax=Tepidimonas alkaliphilus TaxID=2588942 RepID=A0A554W4S5_9BURK|nr:CHAD domain-containing protein [Tepidimonas alkaliphilus]TSE18564.1 Inorganic triphosphatase [Tepidimonas alkaliphilus]